MQWWCFFLLSPQQNWTDSEATVVNYFLCFVNIIPCITCQGQRVMGKVFLYDNLLPWGIFKLLNNRYRGFRISTAVSLALHLLFCRSLFPHFGLLSLYQSHHTIFSPSLDFFLAALAPRCVYATSQHSDSSPFSAEVWERTWEKKSCAVNVRSCFWANSGEERDENRQTAFRSPQRYSVKTYKHTVHTGERGQIHRVGEDISINYSLEESWKGNVNCMWKKKNPDWIQIADVQKYWWWSHALTDARATCSKVAAKRRMVFSLPVCRINHRENERKQSPDPEKYARLSSRIDIAGVPRGNITNNWGSGYVLRSALGEASSLS